MEVQLCDESLISRQQLAKMAKDSDIMAIMIKPIETPPTAQHSAEMRALLEEYKDMFPGELPAGLPPKRNIDHEIVLEPGTKLPSRPLY